MLYEKKLMILSGEGKGVVLMEKSALGVRFTLRSFDLPPCDAPKAGVITGREVFIRDLSAEGSADFTLGLGDISELHIAVFDKRLLLYGTNTKPMWEANVIELLLKHDRRFAPEPVSPPALPPIAAPPEVLPLPDGTGIPQSRLAVYGDEALSEEDFYTKLDMSARMPAVDKFLDSPRVLEGLSPLIEPRSATVCSEEDAESDDGCEEQSKGFAECAATAAETEGPLKIEGPPEIEEAFKIKKTPETEKTQRPEGVASGLGAEEGCKESGTTSDEEYVGGEMKDTEYSGRSPWEMEAAWLKKRSLGEVKEKSAKVRPIESAPTVKKLRESDFTERTRRDVDKLFSSAPRDETLSALLPDVEWVRVETEGRYIGVGRSELFLCYAVGGEYEKTSPLGEEAQWLPERRDDPTGKGFWLIFQSRATGDIIGG